MKEYTVQVFEDKTEWRFEGKLHRDNGPAIEDSSENKYWYKEGLLHRDDDPAFECSNGTKEWFKEGKRHRLDGPAIDYVDGNKEWYIKGIKYTEEEFNALKNCPSNVTIDGVEYRLEKV